MSVDYNHGVHYLPSTVPRGTRLTIDQLEDVGISEQKNYFRIQRIVLSYTHYRIHPCTMGRLHKRRSIPSPPSVLLPRAPQVDSSWYRGCQSHSGRCLPNDSRWLLALWGISLRARPLDTPGLPLCSRRSCGHGMVRGKNTLPWHRQQTHS